MKTYELREVLTAADQKQFLNVAAIINGKDPLWVQPLDQDIESVFNPKKNAQFENGEAIRWVLWYDGKAVGRIAAFYNRDSAAIEDQPTGGCGFFECIDNQEAADTLFTAARNWLAGKGMEAMDGSINFGDRLFWWGVLVEGFTMPIYGMNYNQPYYGALFEGFGFENYFNQYIYLRKFNPEIKLNPALREKAERLYANPEYSFRGSDIKNIKKLAEDFRKVYNSGWANFEGVKPLTEEHALAMVKGMKPVIDPEMLIFAYHNDEPVGFFVMLPDLNQITKKFHGKFGLWSKLKLVWQLKVTKSVTRLSGLIFGVAVDYQRKGIEAGMIRHMELETDKRRGTKNEQYNSLEMMWVGDFNPVMMRMCESYVNAVKHRRLVTYRYLFDRQKPFTRCPRLGSKRRENKET